MRKVWGRRDMHAVFWWGNPKESGCFEYLGVDWGKILIWMLKNYDRNMWNDFICQDRSKWHILVHRVT
jgi:hypothetical protein